MIALGESFIKVCGVTSVDDATLVVGAGADALGLVLATSPRRVDLATACAVAEATKGSLVRCAVFRDNDDEDVYRTLESLDVDAVQIHGTLSVALLDALRARDVLVIKALSIGSAEFWDYQDELVDAVLVDGATPGSGREHPWGPVARRVFHVPLIAAGGVGADNVASVVEAVRPWGVDSASATERSPGRKDPARVSSFVANAREALASLGER